MQPDFQDVSRRKEFKAGLERQMPLSHANIGHYREVSKEFASIGVLCELMGLNISIDRYGWLN